MTTLNTHSVETLERTIAGLEQNLQTEEADYQRLAAKYDALKETPWSTLVMRHLAVEIELILEDIGFKALMAGILILLFTAGFLASSVIVDFMCNVIALARKSAIEVDIDRIFHITKSFDLRDSIRYYYAYSVYAAIALVSLFTALHVTSLSLKIKLKDLI